MRIKAPAVVLLLLSCSAEVHADEIAERRVPARERPWSDAEHRFVVGLGGALELEMGDRSFHAGGSAFFELEVIEDWLEIEIGVSALRSEVGVEMPVDLLFKKPFRLARGVELMVGAGPEVVHVFGPGIKSRTFFGVEGALDFMFWPTPHIGFWVEPTYDLVLRDRASLSFGTTAGPIVGW